MTADRALVERLAALIADGVPIDRAVLGRELAASPEVLENALAVAEIAAVHRGGRESTAIDLSRRVVPIEEGRARRTLSGDAAGAPGPASVAFPSGTPSVRSWGPLDIVDKVGEGAKSEVFRAYDPSLDRTVALKLLKGDGAADAALAEKMLAEGRAMARVSHRNVVTVHGADRNDGRVGLWMEYIEGRTLESWLAQNGPCSAGEAVHTGRELCAALAAVHATGLVHRDVKTQNVMREAGGRLVLMDFGMGQMQGRATQRSTRLQGTPLYLAPEVLEGAPASVRSDLYGLGVLLFHLLTGCYPVTAESLDGLVEAHRNGTRVRLRDLRPDLPAPFVEHVERALDPDSSLRFGSAGEMDAALARSLDRLAPAVPFVARAGRPRWLRWAAVAVLVVAVAGTVAAVRAWWPRAGSGVAGEAASLAVLPLLDATGGREYLADGLTEAMIQEFGALPGLRVTSRASVMRFRQPDRSLPSIAQDLGVDHVLEGSVRDADGRIRLSVRLMAASQDAPLWRETFEVPAARVLELPVRVADRLRAWLGQPSAAPGTTPAPSAEADDEYLRGRSEFLVHSVPAIENAVRHFRVAVALDPHFAHAWAALSEGEMWLADARPLATGDSHGPALAAARRALALDATSPEALTTLARISFVNRNFDTADSGFRFALRYNPSSIPARVQYAKFLAARGLTGEALQQMREARRLDPLSSDTLAREGVIQYYARNLVKSEAAFTNSLTMNRDSVLAINGLGRTLLAMGRPDEAKALLEDGRRRGVTSILAEALIAVADAEAGRTASARETLRRLEAQEPSAGLAVAAPLVWLRAALGDIEGALDSLESAIDGRVTHVLYILVDARYDRLRANPRFEALVERIGLRPSR